MVLISHDERQARRSTWPALRALRERARAAASRGGYGDFSHLDRYFAAVDWLDANGIDYDWLENLTGQDYPLRPIAEIEDDARRRGLRRLPAVQPRSSLSASRRGADQGAAGFRLVRPRRRGDAVRLPALAARQAHAGQEAPDAPADGAQPACSPGSGCATPTPRWACAAAHGVRPRLLLLRRLVLLHAARATARRYVRDYARANPEMVAFFRHRRRRRRCSSTRSSSTRASSASPRTTSATSTGPAARTLTPRTLGIEDLAAMLASGAHWARKLDLDEGRLAFRPSRPADPARPRARDDAPVHRDCEHCRLVPSRPRAHLATLMAAEPVVGDRRRLAGRVRQPRGRPGGRARPGRGRPS